MVEYAEKFHWVDYLLFALSLVVTLVVGISVAARGKWLSQTSESYLMANRRMNWFLVALSFWASVMTSRQLVLFTAEYYYTGMSLIWVIGSMYIGATFVVIFVIPKFYRLGFIITSTYEYFEHRFSLHVRMLVGIMYFFISIIYLAVALYLPCLVLSQEFYTILTVSVINIYWSIFMASAVCIIYTGFGGLKAVVWVDSIQILIITVAVLSLIIKGTMDIGGIKEVWRIYSEIGKRDTWDDTDTSPWDRSNILVNTVMWGVFFMAYFGVEQTQVQRYLTVPDMRRSQRSVLIGTTMGIFFMALTPVVGMLAFATVGGNDPLRNGKIDTQDQILPYFLMYGLGRYHGIPGLVVAAILAAALSTLSSGQNALAAVLLEDVIRPIHQRRTGKPLSRRAASVTSKILGISVGIGTMAIGMAVPDISGTLLGIGLSLQQFILGPLFGLLVVGLFFVWVESWGACIGLLCAVAWTIMLWSGARVYGHGLGRDRKPLFLDNFTSYVEFAEPEATPNLFDVAYMWYTMLAVAVVLIVSTIVSLFVHSIKKCRNPKYSMRSTFPSKEFRYTTDDFLVSIGYRKNVIPYNKPTEVEQLQQIPTESTIDGKLIDQSCRM